MLPPQLRHLLDPWLFSNEWSLDSQSIQLRNGNSPSGFSMAGSVSDDLYLGPGCPFGERPSISLQAFSYVLLCLPFNVSFLADFPGSNASFQFLLECPPFPRILHFFSVPPVDTSYVAPPPPGSFPPPPSTVFFPPCYTLRLWSSRIACLAWAVPAATIYAKHALPCFPEQLIPVTPFSGFLYCLIASNRPTSPLPYF